MSGFIEYLNDEYELNCIVFGELKLLRIELFNETEKFSWSQFLVVTSIHRSRPRNWALKQ